MYEDVARQKAPRATLSLDELEEDALVALAREGKRDVSGAEKADAMLLQLLYWFKKSFKWVDQPDCDVCGSASVRTGMGSRTRESLHLKRTAWSFSDVETAREKSGFHGTMIP
jgi:peptide-N4-(N-acetyl-beta-glucosaminyl)asparagine amidase